MWNLKKKNYLIVNISLPSPKEEQPMKQNGSLCSVIAGNLADVTLATQTWFQWEQGEIVAVILQPRWLSYPTATTLILFLGSALSAAEIILSQTDHLSPKFMLKIIIMSEKFWVGFGWLHVVFFISEWFQHRKPFSLSGIIRSCSSSELVSVLFLCDCAAT